MSILRGEGVCITLIEIRTRLPIRIVAAIDLNEDVTDLDILWTDERRSLIKVETTALPPLGPVATAGVPLETPFDIRDGIVELRLAASAERLSALNRQLEKTSSSYAINRVSESSHRTDDGLTDRQREVLLTAIKLGYYETPRCVTLTDLADALDITKATCSEILQRAERTVVDWYVEEQFAARPLTPVTNQ